MPKDREDLIYHLIHQRIPAEQIFRLVDQPNQSPDRQKGDESELLFLKRIRTFYWRAITSLRPSSPQEDIAGADFYLNFRNWIELPVQVKSSDALVLTFKQDSRYFELFEQKIIVINSAVNVPNHVFRTNFSSEVKRIKNLTT